MLPFSAQSTGRGARAPSQDRSTRPRPQRSPPRTRLGTRAQGHSGQAPAPPKRRLIRRLSVSPRPQGEVPRGTGDGQGEVSPLRGASVRGGEVRRLHPVLQFRPARPRSSHSPGWAGDPGSSRFPLPSARPRARIRVEVRFAVHPPIDCRHSRPGERTAADAVDAARPPPHSPGSVPFAAGDPPAAALSVRVDLPPADSSGASASCVPGGCASTGRRSSTRSTRCSRRCRGRCCSESGCRSASSSFCASRCRAISRRSRTGVGGGCGCASGSSAWRSPTPISG